jgi:hypothetical protein
MTSSLRSVLLAAFCTAGVFLTVSHMSCRKDKCKMLTCDNEGICDGGVCFCPPGYGGPLCDTAYRPKFLGNWTVQGTGTTGEAAQYPVSILASSPDNKVLIENFDNFFTKPVVAYVSLDSINIPLQELQAKYIQGAGFYDDNSEIQIHYSITDSVSNITTTVNKTWQY